MNTSPAKLNAARTAPEIVFGGTDLNIRVSDGLFGANYLFHKDRLEGGSYDAVFAELGFSAARYPGGSVSEWFFDIADPDRTSGVRDGRAFELTPLSEFMRWAGTNGIEATIVIPTSCLVSGPIGNKKVDADAYATVKTFVSEVLAGKYGDAKIAAFELGNEYWLEGELDAREYTEIASVIAEATQAAIDLHKAGESASWKEPDIVVQVGQYGKHSPEPGWKQNEWIMSHLSDAAVDAIDAVNVHYYVRRGFDAIDEHDYYFDRLDAWTNNSDFAGIDYYVTEWNVENWDTEEFGLMQASTLLDMTVKLVLNGVDAAFIWPVQHNTDNDLAGRQGSHDLSISGEMIKLVNTTLPGAQLDGVVDFSGGTAYHFQKGWDEFIFVSSRSDVATTIALDVSDIAEAGDTIDITILGSKGAVNDPDAVADLETFAAEFDNQFLELDLDPYEVALVQINDETPMKTGQMIVFCEGLAPAVDGDMF